MNILPVLVMHDYIEFEIKIKSQLKRDTRSLTLSPKCKSAKKGSETLV